MRRLLVGETVARFVDDCAADCRIQLDFERGHHAGEHLAAADDQQELEDLARRQQGAEGRERLVVRARALEHLGSETEHDPSVAAEARSLEFTAPNGRDLRLAR